MSIIESLFKRKSLFKRYGQLFGDRKVKERGHSNIEDNKGHDIVRENVENVENVKNRKYHIIAVASGKGGVGKTTIAANLGVALSKIGKKVVIIDMDLAMPNLEIITGLRNPPVGLIDALEEKLDLDKVTYTGPMRTKIIPPGIMLDGYSKEGAREKIIKLFRNFPIECDYVVLDMPPGREAIDILSDVVDALLVINADKASILDAINMRVLLQKKGVNILGAVLNRSENELELVDEIERVLETKVLAVIPDSRVVKDATNSEECFVVMKEDSIPSKEIMEVAREIIRNEENNDGVG